MAKNFKQARTRLQKKAVKRAALVGIWGGKPQGFYVGVLESKKRTQIFAFSKRRLSISFFA